MQGKEFPQSAQHSMAGASEPHWRSAVGDAYYALFLECRETLSRWGFQPPRRDVHAWVRLRFIYSTEPDLKAIGYALEELCRLRNDASYELAPSPHFSSDARPQAAITRASDNIALLEQIDGDPQRQAAAIASITP